jgi:hypothetical protein
MFRRYGLESQRHGAGEGNIQYDVAGNARDTSGAKTNILLDTTEGSTNADI